MSQRERDPLDRALIAQRIGRNEECQPLPVLTQGQSRAAAHLDAAKQHRLVEVIRETLVKDGANPAELLLTESSDEDIRTLLSTILLSPVLELYGQKDEGLLLTHGIRTSAYLEEAAEGLIAKFLTLLLINQCSVQNVLQQEALEEWESLKSNPLSSVARDQWISSFGFPVDFPYERLIITFAPTEANLFELYEPNTYQVFNTLRELREFFQLESMPATKKAKPNEDSDQNSSFKSYNLVVPCREGFRFRFVLAGTDKARKEERRKAYAVWQLRHQNCGAQDISADPFQLFRGLIFALDNPEQDFSELGNLEEKLTSSFQERITQMHKHNLEQVSESWMKNCKAFAIHYHATLRSSIQDRNTTSTDLTQSNGGHEIWNQVLGGMREMADRVAGDEGRTKQLELAQVLLEKTLPIIIREQERTTNDETFHSFAREVHSAREVAAKEACGRYNEELASLESFGLDDEWDNQRWALLAAVDQFEKTMQSRLQQGGQGLYLPAGISDLSRLVTNTAMAENDGGDNGGMPMPQPPIDVAMSFGSFEERKKHRIEYLRTLWRIASALASDNYR